LKTRVSEPSSKVGRGRRVRGLAAALPALAFGLESCFSGSDTSGSLEGMPSEGLATEGLTSDGAASRESFVLADMSAILISPG